MRDDIQGPIQRLLALRQHPGFANADLSELANMAENLVEVEFAAGTVVASPESRVPALHLVVEGQLVTTTPRGNVAAFGPRQVFGVLEVIANRAVSAPVVAMTETRTLQLGAADLSEILEDNLGLLSNARRGIARHLLLARARSATWHRPLQVIVPSPQFGLVERLIVLRQHLPFARIQPLAALAQATHEVEWAAGEIVRHAGDHADGALVILEGAVRSRQSRAPVLVPNDAVGMLETLAEQDYTETTEAVTRTRTLHVPAHALFDVMEDHTDLALGTITMLAGELLDVAGDTDDLRMN
jgi:CRP-like cAMP-binding protein